jgi:2-desacetyl-2-hydroxyethyl bacteriochlorophyllide A dehydrogenase
MKVLVKFAEGTGNLEIREMPRPVPKDDEALVEIKAVGICGSDLQHYHSLHKITIPVVLGHEFSGDIVEVGGNVGSWSIGDRIASETHAHICKQCYLCRTLNYYLCKERKGFGSGVHGAFAKYISVPVRLLHRIPDNISYEEATVIQPAADVFHAVYTNTTITPGSNVVVFGPGPMGLLSVHFSRLLGAGRIIVVGLSSDKERMLIAKKMGADYTINLEKESLIDRVREITDGTGADVILEASGSAKAFYDGLKILAIKGQVTIIGVPTEPVELSLQELQHKEQRIQTSVMSSWPDYERVIQLIEAEKLSFSPLVTHILPIEDWEKGFELALSKKACKVVFTPTD